MLVQQTLGPRPYLRLSHWDHILLYGNEVRLADDIWFNITTL